MSTLPQITCSGELIDDKLSSAICDIMKQFLSKSLYTEYILDYNIEVDKVVLDVYTLTRHASATVSQQKQEIAEALSQSIGGSEFVVNLKGCHKFYNAGSGVNTNLANIKQQYNQRLL